MMFQKSFIYQAHTSVSCGIIIQEP